MEKTEETMQTWFLGEGKLLGFMLIGMTAVAAVAALVPEFREFVTTFAIEASKAPQYQR